MLRKARRAALGMHAPGFCSPGRGMVPAGPGIRVEVADPGTFTPLESEAVTVSEQETARVAAEAAR